MVRAVAVFFALATLGCRPVPDWDFEACDAFDESLCALPWPSDYQAVPDASTETGWQVRLIEQNLPINVDGIGVRTDFFNERDGFSIGTPALASFGPVDLERLPGHATIERYLQGDVESILLDVRTGERLAHWVELDAHAADPEDRLLILWPAKALDFGGHYLVAYRNLRDPEGADIAPSTAFAAIRDNIPSSRDEIEGRRRHYEQVIFPALEEQGFARDDLTLAWDFHTSSRTSSLGRMEQIRDDALEWAGPSGPPYEVIDTEEFDCDDPDQHTFRMIRGRFTVPNYTDAVGINSVLNRDEQGRPFAEGERRPPFLVRVPCSLKNDPEPAFVLQYGHGLLGTEREARAGWIGRFLNENRMLLFASPWTGMATEDSGAIALMIVQDIGRFAIVPERSMQGFVEKTLAARMAMGGLASDELLTIDGTPLIQPGVSQLGYYGISQGGILGGAYMGLSPDIERGVLSVAGAPYPLLLPRSTNFGPFFQILQTMYEAEIEQMFLIHALFIHLWDVGESVGWSHDLLDPPEGIPQKRLLLQAGMADAQVAIEGSRYQARSVQAAMVAPVVNEIYGLPILEGDLNRTTYVEYDYGIPAVPDTNLPPENDNPAHECVRRTPAAQQQVVHFLRTGEVRNFCEGPCVYTVEEGC
ncbi:MAG: hypothetical protein EA397_12200 [Deltaproteobacteria bacterium]|nr:MAG: hypothetical protein EA397_12200 [Deltaproteobacteria bacterium]